MKRLYKFYPDFLKILVYEEEYLLEDFRREALGQTIDENRSTLHQLWMWRTITMVKYLFWWCAVVVMTIPLAIGVVFGFTAPLAIFIGILIVVYPAVFWVYVHAYLDQSYGYQKFQKFLGEYNYILKAIITEQKKTKQV
jgi:hypothetical protein